MSAMAASRHRVQVAHFCAGLGVAVDAGHVVPLGQREGPIAVRCDGIATVLHAEAHPLVVAPWLDVENGLGHSESVNE
jgi:hypothetical protein